MFGTPKTEEEAKKRGYTKSMYDGKFRSSTGHTLKGSSGGAMKTTFGSGGKLSESRK